MKTKTSKNKGAVKNEFAFIKPLKVSKTKTGNLLIYINHTTAISLHPNFIKAILEKTAGVK